MTSAANILRERATIAAADGRPRDSAIIAGVAKLIDDCLDNAGDAMCCSGWVFNLKHTTTCKLAALERAITGESDATSK